MEHKQIVITEFGDANVLAIQSAETPIPKSGEVLVKVHYAGVNPIDVKTRRDLAGLLPRIKTNCLGCQVTIFLGKSSLVVLRLLALLWEMKWPVLLAFLSKVEATANMFVFRSRS